jgi:hypothetical protein
MLPAWATVLVAIAGAAVTGVIAGLLTTRLRIQHEREERLRERMLTAADDFVTGAQQAHRGLWETMAAEEQGSTVAERLPAASELVKVAHDRLARVKLLFGTDTPAGQAAEATNNELWNYRSALEQEPPASGLAAKANREATAQLNRFTALARAALEEPWRLGENLDTPARRELTDGDNTPRSQPDFVVAWLAYLLGEAQAAVSWPAYTRLSKRWARARWPELYFNYAYAIGWAAVLIALIAVSYASPRLRTLCAVVATWRFAEIAVWYVKLLFDSTHRLILSAERNLLFLTIDAAETVAIVGLWLAAAPGAGPGNLPEWSAALKTFTLNGAADGYQGWQADVATVIGTVGGLVLIGAGLALLVGLVSERFRYGPAHSYTGPVRLPKPRWEDYRPGEAGTRSSSVEAEE